MRQNKMRAIDDTQDESFASMIVATPAATSPHGWVRGPRAMANQIDMLSIPVCHLGTFFGSFASLNLRRLRMAMITSATPMAIFTASAAKDGAVLGFGGLLPVTTRVNAMTRASDTSQPKMNAAPFRTPFLDARTRMNAVSGIGSREIARPISRRLKTMT